LGDVVTGGDHAGSLRRSHTHALFFFSFYQERKKTVHEFARISTNKKAEV
jgi:hypothetical protein